MINKQMFIAKGTVCDNCADVIKEQAIKVRGVKSVEFNCADETGSVVYDSAKTDIDSILDSIEKKGYECSILDSRGGSGWIFAVIGMLVIAFFMFTLAQRFDFQLSQNMGYGLLFAVGLLTGFHCVSMCGGFVLGYTAAGGQSYISHLLYGFGKVVSYTVIGAVFGLFGSIIAFTPFMRGMVGIFAGIFMVLFSLKMLKLIPFLNNLKLPMPKMRSSSPLVIGLLNGLMIACGPLQAIYIMAAGTGSLLEGAKMLFIFALGTLPVMIGFGFFASYVGNKLTSKIVRISGALVLILGLMMINNGLVLTGHGIGVSTDNVENEIELVQGYQEIRMDVTRKGWEPDRFNLKKGVPVRWIITGKEINGCNNAIHVAEYGLEFRINQGEQVIEFTPEKEGVIRWSCWMGMIPGVFVVSDDVGEEVQDGR